MKKKWWKNGTCERSGWELGSEREECGTLCGCSFVCVHVSEMFEHSSKFKQKKNWRGLLFSNISTDPCETCSSQWHSQQNRVSLVAVKLMLSTDEIQTTWIYLPSMCCKSTPRSLGGASLHGPCWFSLYSSASLYKTLLFWSQMLSRSCGAFQISE